MVYILSWNVSGWSATVGHILRQHHTVDAFYEKHGSPDIICLQEMKIDQEKLKKLPDLTRIGPSHCLHGASCTSYQCPNKWTSFWSISRHKKGYSGVTTFARKNTVVRATSKIFNDSFDSEGRCLATLHDFSHKVSSDNCTKMSRLLVFNVYVPYGGSSDERLAYKYEFLHKLAAAILRLKQEWHVEDYIVAGDLNVSLRDIDVHWLYRTFPADFDVTQHDHLEKNRDDILNLREIFRKESGLIDFEGAMSAARKKRIPGDFYRRFAQMHGILPVSKAVCTQTFRSLFVEGRLKLVDSFARCHKDARQRFTCWDQSRNRRFKNIGTRIDYILISESLEEYLWPIREEGDRNDASFVYLNEDTSFDPLRDATANGKWMATTDPLHDDSLNGADHAYQFLRTRIPHTGIIYTPPMLSDHVAVTLKLDFKNRSHSEIQASEGAMCDAAPVPGWDEETRACNVASYISHSRQRDIKSFFASTKK